MICFLTDKAETCATADDRQHLGSNGDSPLDFISNLAVKNSLACPPSDAVLLHCKW